jgi:CRP-like cAMP-binding protein
MNSAVVFNRQIEAMYGRLKQLYSNVDQPPSELIPETWKELGVAMEVLQRANEELQQQSAQVTTILQNLTQQQHYYQNLLNHIPEAHLVTTADGRIQEANFMAARLLRVPQSFLIDKSLLSFVPSSQHLVIRSRLARLAQGNQPRVWLAWFQPRDLAPIYLALTTAAVYDSNSKQVNIHWILRETTETWATIASQSSSFTEAGYGAASRPIQTYSKGELISLCPQFVWQVQQGLVKLHTLTEENEEVLIGLLRSPLLFGTGSAFLPTYQATALTNVQLIQFSFAEVKASPTLAQLLLPNLNQRTQQMECLLAISGQRRVRNRLYLLLKLLQQEIGQPFGEHIRLSLRLTHEDLANACCTSRVTMTRLLGELQRQGKIEFDDKFRIVLIKQAVDDKSGNKMLAGREN